MTRATQLSIETDSRPGGMLLKLSGELDMATAPRLEGEIASASSTQPAAIVLDLRGLDFIDSTGLRTLITEHERSLAAGRTFALVQGSKQVDRLMLVTRVAEHLQIVSSPDDILV